jgi:hypothetical protein
MDDFAYLTLKPYKIDRPSCKLAEQNTDPFKITKKISNVYKLRLPAFMQIYSEFSLNKLRKAPNNPLPS